VNAVTGHHGSLPPAGPDSDRSATAKSRWHLLIGGLLALAVLVAARSVDVEHYVGTAQRWAEPLGLLGPVVYGLVYVAATLLGAPSMPFTVLAPVLFGVTTGAVTMVAASSASAAGGFLIARYLARDAVAARLADSPAFVRLRALVEEHDWLLIPVLRTFPVAPFVVVNYGFGLTRIGFGRYFCWSAVAMVPSNIVLVLGARAIFDAAARGVVSWPVVGGTIAAGLVSIGLVVLVKRARGR
jgi:uncharacterized membrane protein YdjX (TVP38/TMEM64 family)